MKSLKRVLAIALLMIIVFSSSVLAFEYDIIDVKDLIEPASEWAKPEIDKAEELGLLTENTSLFFKNDITRVQFAELVINLVEKVIGQETSPASGDTFTDSKDISVLKAYETGIVTGISDTTFEPDTLITREQIATMLYRAINYIEKENSKEYIQRNYNIDKYTDREQVSSWAKEGVGTLANNNIMLGTSDTTLSPRSNATIEQCVILVYRLNNTLTK